MDLYRQRCLFVTHQIHKCVLKLAPAYLSSNKFFSNSTFGYDCTRGRDKLHLIRPMINFGKNYLQFKGVQLYNSLPGFIRMLKNLSAFRRVCVAYFLVK